MRDPTWDWMINIPYTLYFSPNGTTPQAAMGIVLPFHNPSQGGLDSEPNGRPQLFKEDGWILVARDFGSSSAAPAYPYLILYNKYRGTLRLYLYNPYLLNTAPQYLASLGFHDSAADTPDYAAAMLTFQNENGECFRTNYDPTQKIITMGNVPSAKGWGRWDFILAGYDPDLAGRPNVVLTTNIKGLNTSNITMTTAGDLTLDQVLKEAPPSGGDSGSIKDAINTGISYYKTVSGWQTQASALLKNDANKSQWWYSYLQTATTSAAYAYAPWAGALAGVVSEFIGGESKASRMEPMNFKGAVKMNSTGEIVSATSELGDTPGFYVHPKAGPWEPGEAHVVQTIPWGVFSVESQPEVLARPVYKTRINPVVNKPMRYLAGYECQVTMVPLVRTNPAVDSLLVSTAMAYTYSNNGPSSYSDDPGTPRTIYVTEKPTGLSYKLCFEIPNPATSDRIVVLFKTFPIKVTTGLPIYLDEIL